jgi:AcrR family transcriptional regulator
MIGKPGQAHTKMKSPKPTRQYGGVNADQRVFERREKFIAAGLEAFGVHGYNQSTIKTICGLAGLTERYFYESFENKEALLCAVNRRLTDELEMGARLIMETPGFSPEETVFMTVKSFYLLFLNNPRRARVQLFEVLGVSPRVDREYQDAVKRLSAQIGRNLTAVFPALDREWLQKSILPMTMAGGMIANAHKWVLENFQTPIDDIVTQSVEMFMVIGGHYHAKRLSEEH